MVTSTDSSLSGYGVTRPTLPMSVVKEHGRLSERLRFRKLPSQSHRTRALVEAGVYQLVTGECEEGLDWYEELSFKQKSSRVFEALTVERVSERPLERCRGHISFRDPHGRQSSFRFVAFPTCP